MKNMHHMSGGSGDDFVRRYEYKVPGGKLLRAKVKVEDKSITYLQISGDFFLSPETDLEDLEAHLIGVGALPEVILEKITSFFKTRNTTIVGASPTDFAHIINRAIKS